jgi:hypothetical protein
VASHAALAVPSRPTLAARYENLGHLQLAFHCAYPTQPELEGSVSLGPVLVQLLHACHKVNMQVYLSSVNCSSEPLSSAQQHSYPLPSRYDNANNLTQTHAGLHRDGRIDLACKPR